MSKLEHSPKFTREMVAAVIHEMVTADEFGNDDEVQEIEQYGGLDWYASCVVRNALETGPLDGGLDRAAVVRVLIGLVREVRPMDGDAEKMLTMAETLLEAESIEQDSAEFYVANGMVSWHQVDGVNSESMEASAAAVLNAALWVALNAGERDCSCTDSETQKAVRQIVRQYHGRTASNFRGDNHVEATRRGRKAAAHVVDVLEHELTRLARANTEAPHAS